MNRPVVGIAMVKDEADVIEATVRHMLTQVDVVLVADNGSTDGTREILRGIINEQERDDPNLDRPWLEVIDDDEVGYFQSRKMSALALEAGTNMRASWVVPFDADEWWESIAPVTTIADTLRSLPDSESIATAVLYDHYCTDDDPAGETPFESMVWRMRHPAALPKVAARPLRAVTIEQGNHGANYGTPTPSPVLRVHHFPYRSAEQMVRKAVNGKAAYDATDLPDDMGNHWRGYGAIVEGSGPEALHGVFHEHFYYRDPKNDSRLIFDPVA